MSISQFTNEGSAIMDMTSLQGMDVADSDDFVFSPATKTSRANSPQLLSGSPHPTPASPRVFASPEHPVFHLQRDSPDQLKSPAPHRVLVKESPAITSRDSHLRVSKIPERQSSVSFDRSIVPQSISTPRPSLVVPSVSPSKAGRVRRSSVIPPPFSPIADMRRTSIAEEVSPRTRWRIHTLRDQGRANLTRGFLCHDWG
jgi:hypothetical protein